MIINVFGGLYLYHKRQTAYLRLIVTRKADNYFIPYLPDQEGRYEDTPYNRQLAKLNWDLYDFSKKKCSETAARIKSLLQDLQDSTPELFKYLKKQLQHYLRLRKNLPLELQNLLTELTAYNS